MANTNAKHLVCIVLPNGQKRDGGLEHPLLVLTQQSCLKLFIGSEGTLGIMTGLDKHFIRLGPALLHFASATLRLTPVLLAKVAMAQFPDSDVQQTTSLSAGQEIINPSTQEICIRVPYR